MPRFNLLGHRNPETKRPRDLEEKILEHDVVFVFQILLFKGKGDINGAATSFYFLAVRNNARFPEMFNGICSRCKIIGREWFF